MAASFEGKIATLSNINKSSGKAVFSGTLEKQTAGMRGFSCVLGFMTFQKDKQNLNTKSTGKMQNPKYLYISTNYCLLTRNQIKTFVSTSVRGPL